MTSPSAQVFQRLACCVEEMTEFQNGICGILRERMAERLITIPTDPFHIHKLPLEFRPLLKQTNELNLKSLRLACTYRDCRFALHLAIINGELDLVRRIAEYKMELITLEALTLAIEHGQEDIVVYLLPWTQRFFTQCIHATNCECWRWYTQEILDIVARSNLLTLYKLFFSFAGDDITQERFISRTCTVAALNGQLELVKYANTGNRFYSDAFYNGIKIGHVEIVKYFFNFIQKNEEKLIDDAVIQAANDGHLNVLIYFAANLTGRLPCAGIFDAAAKSGHVHILMWLFKKFQEKGTLATLNHVVESGYLDVFKWILQVHGGIEFKIDIPVQQIHESVLYNVKRDLFKGQKKIKFFDTPELACMQHIFGFPLELMCPTTIATAAYLISIGITWSIQLLQAAGESSDIKTLEYMAETSSMGIVAMEILLLRGAKDNLLDLVSDIGLKYPTISYKKAMDISIEYGNIEMIEYLRKEKSQTIPLTGLSTAVRKGHLNLVKYFVTNPTPNRWNYTHGTASSKFCSYEIFVYLVHHYKYCTDDMMLFQALKYGKIEIIEEILDRNQITSYGLYTAMTWIVHTSSIHLFPSLWLKCQGIWSKQRLGETKKEILDYISQQEPFSGPWKTIQKYCVAESHDLSQQ